jgi:hypothetical protein
MICWVVTWYSAKLEKTFYDDDDAGPDDWLDSKSYKTERGARTFAARITKQDLADPEMMPTIEVYSDDEHPGHFTYDHSV